MTISCPHCGLTREIDQAVIPPGATKATCPQCKKSFPLNRDAIAADAEKSDKNQKQPPWAEEADLQKTLTPEDLPKAGFWIRVVASLVDSTLVTIIQFVLGFILGLTVTTISGPANGEFQATIAMTSWLFGTVIAVAYYVFFTGYCGQTPGKMALRIKVIRTNGQDIGYGRAFLRETIAKFISGIIFGAGYLMVAFDEQKQGLHDRMSDTYVIKL